MGHNENSFENQGTKPDDIRRLNWNKVLHVNGQMLELLVKSFSEFRHQNWPLKLQIKIKDLEKVWLTVAPSLQLNRRFGFCSNTNWQWDFTTDWYRQV